MSSRTSLRPARHARVRRGVVAAALALVATGVVAVDAQAAAQAVTSLTAEGFAGRTTADSSWARPSATTNNACLTAGTDKKQAPIPACASTAIDSGVGTLRLTDNSSSKVGTVYSTTSLPTTQGLDVRFSTYQWSSTSAAPADGINFILAATDPTNPAPPASTGPVGGSLGYSATAAKGATAAVPGVTNGYLGFGLDVFGNYRSSAFGGSGCTTTSAAAQNVTVRGPGNGVAGYCIAGTQQVPSGATLDSSAARARPPAVPVEVALNPLSSATTSLGGVPVPASSWMIAYTPVGGSPQTLTGALPTAAALQGFGFPASYYDPTTGLPYQLTFGWAASTGGSNEIHEINNLTSATLNGQLPDLNLALGDDQGGAFLAGSAGTVSVTPSLDASQGPESRSVTVTTTLPTGLVPSNPTSSGYACATSGQVVSCTYAPPSPVSAGQSLPVLAIPVQVGSAAANGLTLTSKVSSTDANPAQVSRSVSIVSFAATATPARVPYGTSTTLSGTGLPTDATGTLVFRSGGSTLCAATLPTVSCGTSPTLAAGSYPVTATYGGDVRYATRTAATLLVVSRAAPELSAGVGSAEVPYGTPDVLTFSGLPPAATGSVTFTSGGRTVCVVADVVVASSCSTPDDLEVGGYPVAATYSGDASFAAASATTSFAVVRAPVDLAAAASQPEVAYGVAETLSVVGLPDGAGGTVQLTDADGTLLCAIDVATAASCQVGTDLGTGSYEVTATYSGDARHLGAQASTSFSVGRVATDVVAATSDSSVPFGSSSTLAFSGLPAGATGAVTFSTGSRTLCTVDVTEASSCLSPADLATGRHVITASYGGDRNHEASEGRTVLTVTAKGSPQFGANASDPAPSYGTADTLSFSGLAEGATGSVVFTAAGRTLCEIDDVTTTTSCVTTDDLDVGGYDVRAGYSGDDDHAPASATTTFRVGRASSAVVAAVAADPLGYGVAQTLSFGGLPQRATGSVTFTQSSGTVLCTVADVTGATSCSTSTMLGAGTYDVTARYSGDDNHEGSQARVGFRVDQAATDLTVGTSAADVPYGTARTLGFGGLPTGATGSVTFTVEGRVLCTVEDVTTGSGCAAPADLPAGTYEVAAAYSGDRDHAGATARSTFVVARASADLSASVGRSEVPYGTLETLAFGGLPPAATGSVVFTSGDTTLCTVPDVTNATSCLTSDALATGRYEVRATYSGDHDVAGSVAQTVFTVVRAVPPFSAAAVSAGVPHGSADTLTFSGLPPTASGSVVFTAGQRTLCTVVDVRDATSCRTADDLPAGVYPVVATYGGDDTFTSVTASTGFNVTPASVAFVVRPLTAQVEHGAAETLVVDGLPVEATGRLVFVSGDRTLCTLDVAESRRCATTTSLAVGSYPVRAVYSGDGDHEGGEATTTFDVVRSTVGGFSAAVDPYRTPYGTPTTLSYAGLPAGATGSVTFTVDGFAAGLPTAAREAREPEPGQVLCSAVVGTSRSCATTAPLDPGEYDALATYSGDDDVAPAVARVRFVVVDADPVADDGDDPGSTTGGTGDSSSSSASTSDSSSSLAATGGPGLAVLAGGLLLLVGGLASLRRGRRRERR